MNELTTQRCRPLEGGAPMTGAEIERHLARIIDWRVEHGAIEKTFEFADYHHTVAFVNAVAWIAHTEDHHPDLGVGYGRCTVRFSTHSVAGLSINDFICAAKVDALLAPGR
jgi:4a-hydroxytetrahydrobiopterin dehydratase